MDKVTILMDRETYYAWIAAHPLGSCVELTVAGTQLPAQVASVGVFHEKMEVRLRISKESK